MKRKILTVTEIPSDLLFTVSTDNEILKGLMSEFPEFQAGNAANICENGKVYFKISENEYILYDPLQKEEKLDIDGIKDSNPTVDNDDYKNIKNILIKNPVNYRRILLKEQVDINEAGKETTKKATPIKFDMKFGYKFKAELSDFYHSSEKYSRSGIEFKEYSTPTFFSDGGTDLSTLYFDGTYGFYKKDGTNQIPIEKTDNYSVYLEDINFYNYTKKDSNKVREVFL